MQPTISKPILFLLALLASAFFFASLGERRLANPDEGRYAEIAREMAATNDFITPRLNGLKYFEKPPMQYWATALSFKVLGETEFAARLYTALCGFFSTLLIFFVGRRLFDEATGLLAALVLAASPYFSAMAEVPTLDMGLTFWMTLAVSGFLLGQRAASPDSARRWMWVACLGMAGAVLSKGLIGVVFPAAAVCGYCLVQRDLSLLRHIPWASGLAIFFLAVSPWFILVSIQNPEFPQFFFIHEHVERFTSNTHRRVAPAWYFVPILLAGILPWTLALFAVVAHAWRAPAHLVAGGHSSFRPLRFVLIFSAFVMIFFSASGSKLPAYILPLFPLLALLVAAYLRHAEARKLAWFVLPILPLALFGFYAIMRALEARTRHGVGVALYQEMGLWLYAASGTLAVAALLATILLRRQRKWLGIAAVSIGALLATEMISWGYEKISPLQSGYLAAQAIKTKLTPQTRLYAVKIWDQSAAFYLGRTLTLVAYLDEFELGQRMEPAKSIPDLKTFVGAWGAPGDAIAIIQPGDVEMLRTLGIHFDIIHLDARRAAIRKREPSP